MPTRRPLAFREGSFVLSGATTYDGKKRTATMLDDQFHVYDTTLRDGAQQEGLNLTVADRKSVV